MVYGKGGNYGSRGNVPSVSYREARTGQGSNPTLSASRFNPMTPEADFTTFTS
jgi:hypothetical protein